MFRNRGELAREIAGLFMELPKEELVASAAANDLSEPLPVEYRADQVTSYRRAREKTPELAIIVEVQHKVDLRKNWTWMSYVANAAADHECRAVLLVATWSSTVAEWARGPFASGHPGFDLKPLVIDLSKLPTLLSEEEAMRMPELAVLRALALRDAPSATAAMETLRGLPSDRIKLYWRAIASGLPRSETLILEKKMQSLEEWADDWSFLPKKFPRLTAKIAAPLVERSRKKGKAEGKLEALQCAALKVLRSKLGKLSSAETAKVRALQDADVLTEMIVQLGLVEGAKQVRAILSRRSR